MSAPRIQDAAALLEQGNPAAAIPLLEKLAGQFPTYVTAHVLLAEAYEAEGDMDRAIRAWHTAYFLLPESPVVRKQRQRALRLASKGTPVSRPRPQQPAPLEPSPPVAGPTVIETPPPRRSAPPSSPVPPTAKPVPPARPSAPSSPRPATARPQAPPPAAQAKPPRPEAPARPTPLVPPPPPARPPAPTAQDTDELDWRPLGKNRMRLDELDAAFDNEPSTDDFAPMRLGRGSTPPAPTPQAGRDMSGVDDLDDLIDRLESAGRIVPQTEYEAETPVDLDADDAEDMVSETLAKIYEAQRQFSEAAATYERLARQHPERGDTYLRKAASLRARANDA